MTLPDLWLRLRALLFPKRVETDLEDEIAFHFEMEVRKHIASGMSEEEARRRARARFGPDALVKEECRDERRIHWIETLIQDIRYAMRGFRRAPAFTLTVVATIALGLGINTAVFTIFNAYVLRPVAVRDPYSLYEFFWITRGGERSFTEQEHRELRRMDLPFSDFYANRNLQVRLNGRISYGELVSGNYFRMLGVPAALGRTLIPADSSAPGREPVAVLSYSAWQNMFGGDREIVGKKILVHGYPLEVIGVAQEGFRGLSEMPLDFWAPLSMIAQLDADRAVRLGLIGRLKHSVSVGQAQAALAPIAAHLTAGFPPGEKAMVAVLRSRATSVPISPQALLVLAPILAAFGLVLLIACANVANIMLARAMARQREIGIRLSLGAARSRLIRQLMTESMLLAVPAAGLGFLISQAVIDTGVQAMFATLPHEFAEYMRIIPLAPDARVFAFMMAAAIAAALMFGLAPAVQATRASVVEAARGDFTNDYRPARLRNALAVAQVAGCAALLITAGVLLRGANHIGKLDTGLNTRGVVEIEVQEKSRQRILSALAADPLVQSVGASAEVPLDSGFPSFWIRSTDDRRPLVSSYNHASPEFFTIFDIPILRGRNFTAEEAHGGAAVAIISNTLARRLWPAGDAVGKSVRFDSDPRSRRAGRLPFQSAQVVGVAGDIVTGLIDDDAQRSFLYFPTAPSASGRALIVRVNGDAENARRKLDESLSAASPGAVEQIHKMQEFVAGRNYPFRVAYWISAAIGAVALLLTIIGIYGVLSFLVTQRTKEIGIRVAMGATVRDVVSLVLRQSLRLAGIGIGIALALGFGMSRLFASGLQMMDTFDAVAYSVAVLLVLIACIGASFFPSLRAARVDPNTVLRHN